MKHIYKRFDLRSVDKHVGPVGVQRYRGENCGCGFQVRRTINMGVRGGALRRSRTTCMVAKLPNKKPAALTLPRSLTSNMVKCIVQLEYIYIKLDYYILVGSSSCLSFRPSRPYIFGSKSACYEVGAGRDQSV